MKKRFAVLNVSSGPRSIHVLLFKSARDVEIATTAAKGGKDGKEDEKSSTDDSGEEAAAASSSLSSSSATPADEGARARAARGATRVVDSDMPAETSSYFKKMVNEVYEESRDEDDQPTFLASTMHARMSAKFGVTWHVVAGPLGCLAGTKNGFPNSHAQVRCGKNIEVWCFRHEDEEHATAGGLLRDHLPRIMFMLVAIGAAMYMYLHLHCDKLCLPPGNHTDKLFGSEVPSDPAAAAAAAVGAGAAAVGAGAGAGTGAGATGAGAAGAAAAALQLDGTAESEFADIGKTDTGPPAPHWMSCSVEEVEASTKCASQMNTLSLGMGVFVVAGFGMRIARRLGKVVPH